MSAPPVQARPPAARRAKPYKGLAMEGFIARWYTTIRQNDPEIAPLVRQVGERLPAGSRLLEVAPGPGYLAIELARGGRYQVVGLDISHSFVRIAREKARQAGVTVDFRHDNAAAMPFADESFDFIVCRAAFKNFTEPVQAVREMRRVLRPGGTALIQDLRGDARRSDIDAYVDALGLNPVNRLLTKWAFAAFLLKNAYTPEAMRAIVAQTDFARCTIDEEGIGMSVWLDR